MMLGMSDLHYNPLDPKLDLSCPTLYSAVEDLECEGKAKYAQAHAELIMLREVIKALREQQARSDKALEDVVMHRKVLVDKLCDIRDTLKVAMKDQTSFATDRRSEAIKEVLRKNFSLDIDD